MNAAQGPLHPAVSPVCSLCVRQACKVCEPRFAGGRDKAGVFGRERKGAANPAFWLRVTPPHGVQMLFADAQKSPEHSKRRRKEKIQAERQRSLQIHLHILVSLLLLLISGENGVPLPENCTPKITSHFAFLSH